jgi:hypothetical protein
LRLVLKVFLLSFDLLLLRFYLLLLFIDDVEQQRGRISHLLYRLCRFVLSLSWRQKRIPRVRKPRIARPHKLSLICSAKQSGIDGAFRIQAFQAYGALVIA